MEGSSDETCLGPVPDSITRLGALRGGEHGPRSVSEICVSGRAEKLLRGAVNSFDKLEEHLFPLFVF